MKRNAPHCPKTPARRLQAPAAAGAFYVLPARGKQEAALEERGKGIWKNKDKNVNFITHLHKKRSKDLVGLSVI